MGEVPWLANAKPSKRSDPSPGRLEAYAVFGVTNHPGLPPKILFLYEHIGRPLETLTGGEPISIAPRDLVGHHYVVVILRSEAKRRGWL